MGTLFENDHYILGIDGWVFDRGGRRVILLGRDHGPDGPPDLDTEAEDADREASRDEIVRVWSHFLARGTVGGAVDPREMRFPATIESMGFQRSATGWIEPDPDAVLDRPLTVGDLRRLVVDLPDSAPVTSRWFEPPTGHPAVAVAIRGFTIRPAHDDPHDPALSDPVSLAILVELVRFPGPPGSVDPPAPG